MARYSKKSQYTQVEDRVIYVLHSPISREVYIGHCRKDLLKDVYKDHLRGERYITKEFTAALNLLGLRPCLHILEETTSTKIDAYHHVIAWTKICGDHSYICLDQGNVTCYMEDMREHTCSVYKRFCRVNLSDTLACEKCIVSIYNRQLCPKHKEDVYG